MRVDSPRRLTLGALTGLMFGALLQKGRVAKYEVILAQLFGREHTVVKVMGTAAAVGAVGVHALAHVGRVQLDVKPLQWRALVAGGVAFGAGLAVLGYCPGTALAAVGEGRKDAVAGTLGMLCGAALFVRAAPRLTPVLEKDDRGKVTLPALTRTRTWPWVAALAAAATLGAVLSRGR